MKRYLCLLVVPAAAAIFGSCGNHGEKFIFGFPLSASQGGHYKLKNAFPSVGIRNVIDMKAPPGVLGRVYAAQLNGLIKTFEVSEDTSVSTFFDIDDVPGATLHGTKLFGFVFDPDFATNRYFYVSYAEEIQRIVIARFTAMPSGLATDYTSGKLLFEFPNPLVDDVIYHQGGSMFFDDNKYLYISLGDGGPLGDPTGRAQNTADLHGSVIRVDPNGGDPYSIPADNPFVGLGGGAREEIYAYGLRHPWRMSRDAVTGNIWVGDVGQDKWEEVNLIKKGKNYGWPIYEGTHEFRNPTNIPLEDFEAPLLEYHHDADHGDSVIGGYVYRGDLQPSLIGRYIYGDYVSGRIWAITMDGDTLVSNEEIAHLPEISAFGQDGRGEIYVFSFSDSTVYQLVESNEVAEDDSLPAKLSETGIFKNLDELEIDSAFVPYEVNSPLWSDGAIKSRWIALPKGEAIGFRENKSWRFPKGALIVKHFELKTAPGKTTRLETRVLFHHTEGWAGYTFVWNEDQTDADLINESQTETYEVLDKNGNATERTWTFPGRTDCLRCHTAVSGRTLGVKTAQLNGVFENLPSESKNQLKYWESLNMFTKSIGDVDNMAHLSNPKDEARSLETRSKSYLDANCSHCHRPNGPTPVSIDFRMATAVNAMGLVNVSPFMGDLGISGAKLILPGDHASSIVWKRMSLRDADQMPPLGTHRVDTFGTGLIRDWIDQM